MRPAISCVLMCALLQVAAAERVSAKTPPCIEDAYAFVSPAAYSGFNLASFGGSRNLFPAPYATLHIAIPNGVIANVGGVLENDKGYKNPLAPKDLTFDYTKYRSTQILIIPPATKATVQIVYRTSRSEDTEIKAPPPVEIELIPGQVEFVEFAPPVTQPMCFVRSLTLLQFTNAAFVATATTAVAAAGQTAQPAPGTINGEIKGFKVENPASLNVQVVPGAAGAAATVNVTDPTILATAATNPDFVLIPTTDIPRDLPAAATVRLIPKATLTVTAAGGTETTTDIVLAPQNLTPDAAKFYLSYKVPFKAADPIRAAIDTSIKAQFKDSHTGGKIKLVLYVEVSKTPLVAIGPLAVEMTLTKIK